MSALMNYGWVQRNPFNWAVPLGGITNFVDGPFNAYGLPFWINTQNCTAGLNVDADPDPDLFLTYDQLVAADIERRQKAAIIIQAQALGCWAGKPSPLP